MKSTTSLLLDLPYRVSLMGYHYGNINSQGTHFPGFPPRKRWGQLAGDPEQRRSRRSCSPAEGRATTTTHKSQENNIQRKPQGSGHHAGASLSDGCLCSSRTLSVHTPFCCFFLALPLSRLKELWTRKRSERKRKGREKKASGRRMAYSQRPSWTGSFPMRRLPGLAFKTCVHKWGRCQ